jgi:hypothetical protein
MLAANKWGAAHTQFKENIVTLQLLLLINR